MINGILAHTANKRPNHEAFTFVSRGVVTIDNHTAIVNQLRRAQHTTKGGLSAPVISR